jgi:hypothetical protein
LVGGGGGESSQHKNKLGFLHIQFGSLQHHFLHCMNHKKLNQCIFGVLNIFENENKT